LRELEAFSTTVMRHTGRNPEGRAETGRQAASRGRDSSGPGDQVQRRDPDVLAPPVNQTHGRRSGYGTRGRSAQGSPAFQMLAQSPHHPLDRIGRAGRDPRRRARMPASRESSDHPSTNHFIVRRSCRSAAAQGAMTLCRPGSDRPEERVVLPSRIFFSRRVPSAGRFAGRVEDERRSGSP